VTIPDANILLYAYNADVPQHAKAADWVEELFSGSEVVGLPWVTLWAFLRISTNSRIWPNPMSTSRALEIVQSWLRQPDVVVVHPGERHIELLDGMVTRYRVSSTLMADAALAAIALEQGAVLASTDQDFRRFPELKWVNPLE
jgi:toxin-antitoxin system PIN domain toxin